FVREFDPANPGAPREYNHLVRCASKIHLLVCVNLSRPETGTIMKIQIFIGLVSALYFVPGTTLAARANSDTLDPAMISELTGLKGQLNEKEKVYKVTLPRSDIAAISHGVKLTPALGLTSWAAFTKAGNHFMMMGDTVLTEG